jgi:hypothetical protein
MGFNNFLFWKKQANIGPLALPLFYSFFQPLNLSVPPIVFPEVTITLTSQKNLFQDIGETYGIWFQVSFSLSAFETFHLISFLCCLRSKDFISHISFFLGLVRVVDCVQLCVCCDIHLLSIVAQTCRISSSRCQRSFSRVVLQHSPIHWCCCRPAHRVGSLLAPLPHRNMDFLVFQL